MLLTKQYTTFDTGLTNGERPALRDFLHLGAARGLQHPGEPEPARPQGAVDGARPGRRRPATSRSGASTDDEQPFLRQLGIDGSFPQADGRDLLAVTTQNAGNNKIDAYLHTSIADHVDLRPRDRGGAVGASSVSLTNRRPGERAPARRSSTARRPQPGPGDQRDLAHGLQPADVRAGHHRRLAGTMSTTPELGVWAYSTYVDVAPGASITVRVDLSGTVAAGPTLRTSVRLQPSANPETVRLDVTPQGPWNVAGSNDASHWNLGPAMRQTNVFHFVSR